MKHLPFKASHFHCTTVTLLLSVTGRGKNRGKFYILSSKNKILRKQKVLLQYLWREFFMTQPLDSIHTFKSKDSFTCSFRNYRLIIILSLCFVVPQIYHLFPITKECTPILQLSIFHKYCNVRLFIGLTIFLKFIQLIQNLNYFITLSHQDSMPSPFN